MSQGTRRGLWEAAGVGTALLCISANPAFPWGLSKCLHILITSLLPLCSWSDVLGSDAAEKGDVVGKVGVFQRRTLTPCAGPCALLSGQLKNGWTFLWLIFISEERAQDSWPLAHYTRKCCDFFSRDWAVLTCPLMEHTTRSCSVLAMAIQHCKANHQINTRPSVCLFLSSDLAWGVAESNGISHCTSLGSKDGAVCTGLTVCLCVCWHSNTRAYLQKGFLFSTCEIFLLLIN